MRQLDIRRIFTSKLRHRKTGMKECHEKEKLGNLCKGKKKAGNTGPNNVRIWGENSSA